MLEWCQQGNHKIKQPKSHFCGWFFLNFFLAVSACDYKGLPINVKFVMALKMKTRPTLVITSGRLLNFLRCSLCVYVNFCVDLLSNTELHFISGHDISLLYMYTVWNADVLETSDFIIWTDKKVSLNGTWMQVLFLRY